MADSSPQTSRGDALTRDLPVPTTLDAALDPAWLTQALSPVTGGRAVTWVGEVDLLETVASKARFAVELAGDAGIRHRFCLKAMVQTENAAAAAATAVREARFYADITPHLDLRVPRTVAVIDAARPSAMLLMEDLIAAGARFCATAEPFTPDFARGTLDQIARLHAGAALLASNGWIADRLRRIADTPHYDRAALQALMDDGRCARLAPATRDAARLLAGLKAIAARFADGPHTILHGDCHAGNFYVAEAGPGWTDWQLVQRGHWALDVAYHINATLPEDVAAREERALLDHYFERLAAHGGSPPPADAAWDDYRAAQVYGYYHWVITRSSPPGVIETLVRRLGTGVERHDTYALLGLR